MTRARDFADVISGQFDLPSGSLDNSEVVDDTSPQLGGNLDVNGNSIVSASNGDIAITPNGTGSVVVDGLSHPQSDGSAGQFLKTDGSGQLSFGTVATDLSGDSTPQLGGVLDTNGNNIEFPDSSGAEVNRRKFGAGDDLQIYHTGTQSIISDSGTGNLNLEGDTKIVLRNPGGTENYAQFFKDGAVELYHNNSKKFETTSSGVTITGDITANNLAVSNTPVVTARKGSDQTISRNTWTKITGFTTNEYDSDSAWNGSRFTVPSGKAGRYLCVANLRFRFDNAGNDGEQAIGAFYVNGGQTTHFTQIRMAASRDIGLYAGTGSVILNLAAGAYVEVYGYMQDDSASGNLRIHGEASTGSQVAFMRVD